MAIGYQLEPPAKTLQTFLLPADDSDDTVNGNRAFVCI